MEFFDMGESVFVVDWAWEALASSLGEQFSYF
jgi:hypothetical protein